MMPFAKILCPTDFSAGADHALELAARLAAQHRAELVIVSAWELPVFAGGAGGFAIAPEVIERSLEDMRTMLDAAARVATELGVARVSTRDLRGVAFRTILDLIVDDRTFDLVVMGTHGRSGIRRVLLGSVAEKVVRMSPISVLAVHPDDHLGPIHRLLCPTDLTDPTELPLQLAAKIVDAGEAVRIELVHVVDFPHIGERSSQHVAIARQLEAVASVKLADHAKLVVAPCPIAPRTEVGDVVEQLLALVEIEPYDLVVVGSHGRTGLAYLMLGSVAEKIVRHARCPVLVAHARAS